MLSSSTQAKASVTLMLSCYTLIKGWHIQTWFDLHGKRYFSNESISETAINNVQ